MIALISPAKSLNFEKNYLGNTTDVRFPDETLKLNNKLKKLSRPKLMDLMHISKDIATLNQERNLNFDTEYTTENSRAAAYAFDGAVYKGMQFTSLSKEDQEYAQDHLRILSGLYGILRPLDKMQAYRLEMGSKLKVGRSKNLYDFWGDKITHLLNQDLEDTKQNIVINLASQEYFKSIKTNKLKAKLINVHFKEYRGETLKVISFSAKTARGIMAKFIIENKITNPESIKGFDEDNYHFEERLSTDSDLVFVR